jgi:hypothetical protein
MKESTLIHGHPCAPRFPSVPWLAALSLMALAVAAPAQSIDFSISKLEVNQAIQTGGTPLAAGRATFVRAAVRVTNPDSVPQPVDGLLHVFADGVETAGSPVFSDNGPFPAKAPIDFTIQDGSLNFIFLPPESGNVVLTVEVNPPGANFVPEGNTANNSYSTAPLSFVFQRAPELAYVPIDYRPNGGSIPNLPDATQIEPGMGDNFVQGIYPTPDWYYHRTDAPSKLWTQSLAGTGSNLLNSLQVDIDLTVPKPDFIYGFVPGGLPYNGQSVIGGDVAMGNTELNRYQRTVAHELGHDFGLQHNTLTTNVIGIDVEHHLHLTENLPVIKPASLKDIMYAGLFTPEAWVAPSSYNFFFTHPVFNPAAAAVAGGGPMLLITGTWNKVTGALALSDVLTLTDGQATPPVVMSDADLIVRTFAGGTQLVELPISARSSSDECPVCRGDADAPASVSGAADASGAVDAGRAIGAHGVGAANSTASGATEATSLAAAVASANPSDAKDAATTSSSADSQEAPLPLVGFTAIVPMTSATGAVLDRLEVAPAASRHATTLELNRSASAPQVAFTSPAAGAAVAGKLSVAWTASDADGDALHYYLRYSPDGKRFVPLATGLTDTQWDVDLARLPALVSGKGFFELLASDGLNTTRLRTETLHAPGGLAAAAGNAPWVQIVSPDSGFTFLKGATVILHSSGWDLEDHKLDGESLQWFSDVDGHIGTGRLTSVSHLTVGTHVLTVQATDSSGLITTDTATITITDRGLPTVGGDNCQADLGFGGPGSSQLSLCGGNLSTGTTATLKLQGAPALAPAFLFAGLVNGATPVKGGTLVPDPWTLFLPMTTDATGQITLPGIAGGNGPLSVYLQFVIVDGAQVQGFGFSNAVRADLLP